MLGRMLHHNLKLNVIAAIKNILMYRKSLYSLRPSDAEIQKYTIHLALTTLSRVSNLLKLEVEMMIQHEILY